MCGIAGIAWPGQTPSRQLLESMCASIAHRGPDGEGIWVAPGVGLGMRRLAVIDLATGDQPMAAADGQVQVVFNGEIYNYRELRADLESRGHSFQTTSDTEVIPHLYLEYGRDFLSRLNGMFAIALWDAREKRLLLARDRVGIKPLLWSVQGDRLIFGSELKPMLVAEPGLSTIDPVGLDQFLTFEYTATPHTLLRGVQKLPPGGWLEWTEGGLREGLFWSVDAASVGSLKISGEQAAEQLRETLTAAVKRQMISDVPLGAFLSGGIDSSILVAAMSEVGNEPPRTFSIGFGDASYDELHYARAVAEHCSTEHREAVLQANFRDHLETVVSHLDQPIADFSVFPTLLVSRVAREDVTVVLSGDGGDELFCGYDPYVADRMARRSTDILPKSLRGLVARMARMLPLSSGKRGPSNTLRVFLDGARKPVSWQHMRWMSNLLRADRERLYTPGFADAVRDRDEQLIESLFDAGIGDRPAAQGLCDLRFYLPENILPKVDLMSMAVSLEARVPYLDNEVLDLALALPTTLKWKGGVRKAILRDAFADRLPPEVVRRGKEGFSMPMKNWLRDDWRDLMRSLLEDASFQATGLFDQATVKRLMDEHERGVENHSHLLWALMLFQLWRTRFLGEA